MGGRQVILLGPQRREPTLKAAVDSLGAPGPVATVTAGWEEREAEDEELDRHLGGGTRNLALFPRAERVFERDPGLLAAARRRHDRQEARRSIYRTRLAAELGVARELMARLDAESENELLEDEIAHAIETVRALDAHHLARMRDLDRAFVEEVRPHEHPEVQRHREEVERLVDECSVVCIAGGHVRVLYERLGLFDVLPLLGERPLVAWSAGAMVLSENIVLFHDSPPEGAGDPEVFGPGHGVLPGIVPLPHASRRLALGDPLRVALFARRFEPRMCPALDPGARLEWDGAVWSADPGTRRLAPSGEVEACA